MNSLIVMAVSIVIVPVLRAVLSSATESYLAQFLNVNEQAMVFVIAFAYKGFQFGKKRLCESRCRA
ncbi:MAG: hypothetical protein J0H83_10665 [Candidatus Melainabacteria bacterium]|jgi:hypothetical protein|nr:hypothetical protein [Candidatus Melainabacteria bacterium]MBX9672880.1 hypothetical protein [Candidatus Obscuribacterales bacterium]